MDNQKNIGKKIKEAREQVHMTQEQLGQKVGFSAMGISYMEQGLRGIKVEHLEKIADVLNLSLSYFLEPITGSSYPSAFYGRINDVMSEDEKKEMSIKIGEFDKHIESKFEK